MMNKERTIVASLALCVVVGSCAHQPVAPESAGLVSGPESFRAKIPEAGPTPVFKAPAPKRHILENGLTVMFVEKPELPLVHMSLATKAGSAMDPKSLSGLSGFMLDAMRAGTKSRSSNELARAIEGLGGSLSGNVEEELMSISSTVLSTHKASAFEILSDVVRHPAFLKAEIERIRRRRVSAYKQQMSEPSRMASVSFRREVAGSHPYGQDTMGSRAGIESVNQKALLAHHRRWWSPENAVVMLVGDLSEADALKLVKTHLGDWKRSASSPGEGYGEPTERASRFVLIDRPNAPQSQLRVGHLGIDRNHPDFYALLMMNAVLGGLFQSRLNMNLREDKGYTYGARSSVKAMRKGGLFVVRTAVRTDVTVSSIEEILNEISVMVAKGVSADELRGAQDRYNKSLAGYFQSLNGLAAMMGNIFSFGLPLDYYQRLPQKIGALGVDDIQRVATKHLRPNALHVVVVGDRLRLEKGLRGLKLGTLHVQSDDGKGDS